MVARMELRHLRYFVAVAEALNFTLAARRLNLSQPPLSQQIRELERELGAPLFERTSRRVELTPAGVIFLDHARVILAEAEQAREDVQAIGTGRTGLVRIGCTGSVLLGPLPGLIAAFGRAHPGIAVRLREMPPSEQVAALQARRLDLIFLRRPPPETDLVVEMGWKEAVGVCLPVGHPLAARARLPLAALEGYDLISLRLRDSRYSQYLRDCCVRAGFTPRIRHEVVESYSLASLVASGLGLALVAESVRSLARPDVVWRPLEPPVPSADVALLYHANRSAAVGHLIDLGRALLGGAAT
jgi:DNA-binding transcriptional LysR family regulator